jgi:hypothetical protein
LAPILLPSRVSLTVSTGSNGSPIEMDQPGNMPVLSADTMTGCTLLEHRSPLLPVAPCCNPILNILIDNASNSQVTRSENCLILFYHSLDCCSLAVCDRGCRKNSHPWLPVDPSFPRVRRILKRCTAKLLLEIDTFALALL